MHDKGPMASYKKLEKSVDFSGTGGRNKSEKSTGPGAGVGGKPQVIELQEREYQDLGI